jgi:pimeloyl-ACP methyl ester carboxylesterase
MPKHEMRDVIVLLPGITGSVLQKDGRDVWAVSRGSVFQFIRTLGASLESLKLPNDDPDAETAPDGIVATRLMPDIHLIPGLWSIDGYGRIRKSILERFSVVEGENYLEFPYDWRRTNRASAQNLKRTAEPALDAWRRKTGNSEARLILIAHSMGGLVSRWYLEKLDGWKRTRSLITFGTPYRGSVNAVDSLHAGMRKRIGPFKLVDLTAALRSFQSVYELLPIYPCVDTGIGDLARMSEAKVPHVDPFRVEAALAFHHEIRDAVAEHQEDPEYTVGGYRIHPITGIEQPTHQSVLVRGDEVRMLRTWKGRDLSGDGTVPRVSAVPLEIVDAQAGMFAGEQHGSLQNDTAVLKHLRGLLTGRSIDLTMFEGMEPARIGVEVEELFEAREPIPISARSDRDDLELTADVSNADSGQIVSSVELTNNRDGSYRVEVSPLEEGCYRVVVGGGVDRVTSLFSVVA